MSIRTPLVPIKMMASVPNTTRTDVKIEQHVLTMDEPVARKGTDIGPTPLDTLVASLAGCTNVVLNKIAAENSVDVSNLELRLESALNVRGILGIEPIDLPLERIDLWISFDCADGVQAIAILMQRLRERCAVSVILRQAGINVREHWKVNGETLR